MIMYIEIMEISANMNKLIQTSDGNIIHYQKFHIIEFIMKTYVLFMAFYTQALFP